MGQNFWIILNSYYERKSKGGWESQDDDGLVRRSNRRQLHDGAVS
jgi:hypothetical protein